MKRSLLAFAALVLAVGLLTPALAGNDSRSPKSRLTSGRLGRISDNAVSARGPGPGLGERGKPQFGNDVQVNPPSDNPGRPHNEFAIAGNPLNPQNLVTGSNDYSTNNTSFTGAYYSTDGGAHWAGGNLPCKAMLGTTMATA